MKISLYMNVIKVVEENFKLYFYYIYRKLQRYIKKSVKKYFNKKENNIMQKHIDLYQRNKNN